MTDEHLINLIKYFEANEKIKSIQFEILKSQNDSVINLLSEISSKLDNTVDAIFDSSH